jgi:hypothetical protein
MPRLRQDTASHSARRELVTFPPAIPAASGLETLDDLRTLHDTLRRSLELVRRTGGQIPRDLSARLAACEADMMEAQFDNMPV